MGGTGGAPDGGGTGGTLASGKWVSAYYAAWQKSRLAPEAIDFGAVTHLQHFALVPNGNGSVDDSVNGIDTAHRTATVSAAHAAGKKILLTVGGAGADGGFVAAAQNTTARATLIANLVAMAESSGYDGIDVDWEPVADAGLFAAFVSELRAAMRSGWALTAAVTCDPAALASVHQHFDQINIMTYDLAGAWPGWVSWHNSPIYAGGCKFVSTGASVPSADGCVESFVAAGIPKEKLGVGIDFYGYVWSGGSGTPTGGVTAPCQSYATDPNVLGNVAYHELIATYAGRTVQWDDGAKAAFIAIDEASESNDRFVSFDNEQSVNAKAAYVSAKGIGGVIVWELGGGYRPAEPLASRDPLLQSIKQAFSNAANPYTGD